MSLGVRSLRGLWVAMAALALMVWAAGPARAQTDPVDYGIYADLLAKYVQNKRVDYAGFKQEQEHFEQFLELMAQAKPEQMSHQDQFAYYINLYNAWTIRVVLRKYPNLDTIRDVGSLFTKPWQIKCVRIGEQIFTLDQIEHEILRPRFQDPRVHFAINNAAISCPPLRNEPYRGETLDAQLEDATISFVNDPERNYIKGKYLHVSKIFTWYKEDFTGRVVPFFLKYTIGKFHSDLEKNPKRINVTYLPYDWGLNGM